MRSSIAAEQLEGFALVFLLGILLRIAAQVNALTQIVHRGEMFAPVQIQLLQHDRLFEVAHDRRTVLLHLGLIGGVDCRMHTRAQHPSDPVFLASRASS